MNNTFTNADAISWLNALAAKYKEKESYLTDLDRAIGDADHGYNMSRGFTAVAEKISSLEGKDIGTILKTTAMTLISTVGGASGPLFGSFFLQAANTANGKTELNMAELGAMLDAGFKSVLQRGKAVVGDKTMVDAMEPAVAAYQNAVNESLLTALDKARQAARVGADSTTPLIAKKGRASYLGERSAGHLDPGAESTTILFDELYNAIVTKD